jgi:hypothetical protein
LLLLIFVVPGLALNLYINTGTFKDIFRGDTGQIKLMKYEYDIAKQINGMKGSRDILIISDPLTMHMLEPISEARSTGGLFTGVEDRVRNWYFLKEVSGKTSNDEFRKQIRDFKIEMLKKNTDVLYIFTPRTEEWLAKDKAFIEGYGNQIWSVTETSDNYYIVNNN